MTDSKASPSEKLAYRASLSARVALTGLVLALIVGTAYAAGLGSAGGDASAIDPQLLRLLERAPHSPDGTLLEYLDLNAARQGPTSEFTSEDGEPVVDLDALDWSPQPPPEVMDTLIYPRAFEDAFGYGFDNIERTLLVQGSQFATFVVLDSDASATLDRATTPPGAQQETRSQVGSFDVLDWGDQVSTADRTDLRGLGEAGQLTAFDDNIVVYTMFRDRLDPIIATQNGAPTLAEQQQLMAGLELLDFEASLGLSAIVVPESARDNADGSARLPLLIIETALDGSSRVVLGFRLGADVNQIESKLRELIGSTVAGTANGSAQMMTAFARSEDLVIIDFTPDDPAGRFESNRDLRSLIQSIFFMNPDLLS